MAQFAEIYVSLQKKIIMRNIFKYSIALVVMMAFLMPFTMNAQLPANPIRWRVNVKMSSASEGEVIIKATIDEGWHLYGTKLPQNGPKPTEINLSASKGVQFVGELTPSVAPETYRDPMFDLDLTCWSKSVTFRRKFKVTDAATAVVAGEVRFMGCNNQNCMPPKVEKFSKKVIVKK